MSTRLFQLTSHIRVNYDAIYTANFLVCASRAFLKTEVCIEFANVATTG